MEDRRDVVHESGLFRVETVEHRRDGELSEEDGNWRDCCGGSRIVRKRRT